MTAPKKPRAESPRRKQKASPSGGLEPLPLAEVVEAAAKHAGGRPSEFDPEFCEQVEKLCLLGATDEQIADFFDKSVSTINKWKIDHPEFSEAIKRGKLPSNAEVATSLYKRANWHEYIEQQAIKVKDVIYENGKRVRETERVEIVEVKRVLPPSDTSMIFWLKNRFPEQWRDKVDHAHSGTIVHTHEDRVKRREEVIARRREERVNGSGASVH